MQIWQLTVKFHHTAPNLFVISYLIQTSFGFDHFFFIDICLTLVFEKGQLT